MNDETHRKKHYFSAFELALWLGSLALIGVAFVLWDRVNFLTLCASLIGVTSLLFCAKGNPIGQGLMILFSLLYGVISFSFSYYGEMITYVGMTMPMAAVSLVSWLRNPYQGGRSEVRVARIRQRDLAFLAASGAVVTAVFSST